MFVTRICQNVKINSVEANQGSYRARSEGWMQTLVQKSKGKFAGTDVLLILRTYVLVCCRENPQRLLDLVDSGSQVKKY